MTAGRWDENPWTVEPGADSSWEAEWKDANGAAVDITNYTAALQIRDFYDQTTALISLTSSPAAGIVFNDPVNGKLTVTLTATQTTSFSFKRGVWDLLMTNTPSGAKTRLLEGFVYLIPAVTR
jgi:hypothetical protein